MIAERVETFVRTIIIPYERDPRCGEHGPSEALVEGLRNIAREADVLTPHIRDDGSHFSQRELVLILRAAGLSPLGSVAVNVAAPDEGNMYLLGKSATPGQKERYLHPLVADTGRSAFFMTEPAQDGSAGSAPLMLQTIARAEGDEWVIESRKAFITGAVGSKVGILMTKGEQGSTMFLVDLPRPAIRVERALNTIERSMPGDHAVVAIEGLRLTAGHTWRTGREFQIGPSPPRASTADSLYALATAPQSRRRRSPSKYSAKGRASASS